MIVSITATEYQDGVYHTKDDCPYISKDSKTVEKDALDGDWTECQHCQDGVSMGGHNKWSEINQRLKNE